MKIINLYKNRDFSNVVSEATDILQKGGVIVYPTDTLYALGANALDISAVEKIFKIKQRPKTKPLPIVVKNIKWVKELAYTYDKEKKILKSVWPGPVTVVLQKRTIVPFTLTGDNSSVAMRIAKHDFVDKLLGKFGYPVTSTSANISGVQPSNKISEVIDKFNDAEFKPDLIIDAGDLPESEPSTILDLTSDKPKVLRVGPTKPEVLMKLLEI